ncbi:conserved protein of unknown function [Magnetospirillum sp. XM-1]|uniref:hypothetical protein n=1 Tax=Magnetospirillum sp. XM-1 TaxID=1663591 RepID=UPI00073DC336|nr:hypothetical protein [Magnetospirillum sp. XM-1]CUW41756.1 conserved protein of unknown function [Magnetospirillum sp. XM-1]
MTDTVLSAYAGDLTQMLSTLSGMSARPAFNLAFANMQNAMVVRYNDEVSALQRKALDSYDTNLDKELAQLQTRLPKLVEYQSQVNNARTQLLDRLDDFGNLTSLNAEQQINSAAGDPVDATRYDAEIDKFNASLGNLPFTEGTDVDLIGDEGMGQIRMNGLGLQHFSVDDDDAKTGATYNLSSSLDKLNLALKRISNRLDIVASEVDWVETRITEIKDHQQQSMADIKADVAKQVQQKKLLIAQQLQAVSIGFEAAQASSEKMDKAFTNDTYQPGSVVNLFS